MPDESIIQVDTEDDWKLIREWYADHPEVRERFTLQFPVDVELEDGSIITVNSEEELRDLHDICDDHRGRG